jgi:predicted RNA binding protein YcfA (HicA-like mRNA interferase family)
MVFYKLPSLRAKKVIKILKKAGFVCVRQKGSHAVMKHHINNLRTVVPVHPRETLQKALLVQIISQAGLTVDEFLDLS